MSIYDNPNEYDTRDRGMKAVEFDADAAQPMKMPESAVITQSVHMEIDRLEKALQFLRERIAPTLRPEEPVMDKTSDGAKQGPRSEIVTNLQGVGHHVQAVRGWVEALIDRVDL